MTGALVLNYGIKHAKYGFLLAHILPYKDRIYDSYTGEYESAITRILAYFLQLMV